MSYDRTPENLLHQIKHDPNTVVRFIAESCRCNANRVRLSDKLIVCIPGPGFSVAVTILPPDDYHAGIQMTADVSGTETQRLVATLGRNPKVVYEASKNLLNERLRRGLGQMIEVREEQGFLDPLLENVDMEEDQYEPQDATDYEIFEEVSE